VTASRLAQEMLAGPIDVLTGDYLAELTMLILWKAKQKDDSSGYATTFPTCRCAGYARNWPSAPDRSPDEPSLNAR
jgi:hypothetical protein